jgi:hypothetical protein
VDAYLARVDEVAITGPALLDLMRSVVERGRIFRFEARGFSMHPFIRAGDVLSIEPIPSCGARVGDVCAVVLPQSSKLVVHRVVARAHGDGWVMRGDNIAGPGDGVVPAASLLGRVRRVERGGRSVGFGLGAERWLIALLSRLQWLITLVRWAAWITAPVRQLAAARRMGVRHAK